MIGILYFYLPGCKYCKRAEILMLELQNSKPEFGEIQVIKINEAERPEIAAKFTHARVPAFFLGDRLLYEADPNESRDDMKAMLEKVFTAACEVNKLAAETMKNKTSF